MYPKRIEAYDKPGPGINAVITLNPKALEQARALDKERKTKGPRSPIHGVPILLKDNFDTVSTCRPPRARSCSPAPSRRTMRMS